MSRGIPLLDRGLRDPAVADLIGNGREDHRRHARLHLGRKSDPEIHSEWFRDFILEEFAEALPGGTMHHFPDRPCRGDPVIAVADSGLPEWFFTFEQPDHVVVIVNTALF